MYSDLNPPTELTAVDPGRLDPKQLNLLIGPGVRTMRDPDASMGVEDEGVIIGNGMRNVFHDPPTPWRGLMRSARFAGASA